MGTGGNRRPITIEQKFEILRRALRKIANLDHAEGCSMKCVPLFECTCIDSPIDTARAALGNIGEWDKKWSEW